MFRKVSLSVFAIAAGGIGATAADLPSEARSERFSLSQQKRLRQSSTIMSRFQLRSSPIPICLIPCGIEAITIMVLRGPGIILSITVGLTTEKAPGYPNVCGLDHIRF